MKFYFYICAYFFIAKCDLCKSLINLNIQEHAEL